jgi:dihydroneopterin triphosphate diphosphatase
MTSVDFKTPISVLVLIHTSDLQVLLIERADKAGFWQSVTGSIETEDADLSSTAIREVMEETGLDAKQYKLEDWQFAQTYEIYEHWRYRYAPGVTQNVEHVFGLELPNIVDIKLAPNEHVAYEWVDWREAAKRVFSWTNVEALRLLGERHQLTL